ncbi:hypothetical protein NS44R_15025, partial [Mammaliicoccus sciuri]
MDFARAFIHPHQASLLPKRVHRQLQRHAERAKRLHGGGEGVIGHLRREHLDHRGLVADILAAIGLVGGLAHHQPAGMHARGNIGDPPLDRLALREPDAEGLA